MGHQSGENDIKREWQKIPERDQALITVFNNNDLLTIYLKKHNK